MSSKNFLQQLSQLFQELDPSMKIVIKPEIDSYFDDPGGGHNATENRIEANIPRTTYKTQTDPRTPNQAQTDPTDQASQKEILGKLRLDFRRITELVTVYVFRCKLCKYLALDQVTLENHHIGTHKSILTEEFHGKSENVSDIEITDDLDYLPDASEPDDPINESPPTQLIGAYWHCKICGRDYSKLVAKKKHMKLMHSSRVGVFCPTCEKKFPNQKALKSHKCPKVLTRDKLICPYCTQMCENKQKLSRHIRGSHRDGARGLSCQKCSKDFPDHDSLVKHRQDFHQSTDTPVKCQYCTMLFKRPEMLNNHYRVYHPELLHYQCSRCPLKFITHHRKRKHEARIHELGNVGCKECNKQYISADTLHKHMKRDHPEKLESKPRAAVVKKDATFQCSDCNKKFISAFILMKHQARMHGNTVPLETESQLNNISPWKCPVCLNTYSHQSSERRHLKSVHPELLTKLCPNCDEGFLDENSMKEHILMVHKAQKIKCNFCVRIFPTIESRDEHSTLEHPPGSIVYKCYRCPLSFKAREELQAHRAKTHTERRKTPCKICGEFFVGVIGKLSHYTQKHPLHLRVKCTLCPLKFVNKKQMQNHRCKVHQSDEFRCEECSKVFSCRDPLLKHYRAEHPNRTDKFMHHCKICDCTFSVYKKFLRHNVELHYNKKFQCDHCTNVYTMKGNLNNHISMDHPELLTHVCPLCNKSFYSAVMLKRHRSHAHNAKVMECEFCHTKFSHRPSLVYHRRKYHLSKGQTLGGVNKQDIEFIIGPE